MAVSKQRPCNQDLNLIRPAVLVVHPGTIGLFCSFIILWHIALEGTVSQACRISASLGKGEFYFLFFLFLSFGGGWESFMLLWVMWGNTLFKNAWISSCVCFLVWNMSCSTPIQNLKQSLGKPSVTFLGVWIYLMGETVSNLTKVLSTIDRA